MRSKGLSVEFKEVAQSILVAFSLVVVCRVSGVMHTRFTQ